MTTNNETILKALRRAYALGQIYWQQADSEYWSQNKKSEETAAKFDALIEETMEAISSQPAMPADAAMAAEYQRWIDAHHKGMDYDDFLAGELARRRIEGE